MRVFILLGAALVSFVAALTLSSSAANAVFWRGISAPTNIDLSWLAHHQRAASEPMSVDPGKRGLLRSAMHILIGGTNELRAWIKAQPWP
jgi:hypothetical protein